MKAVTSRIVSMQPWLGALVFALAFESTARAEVLAIDSAEDPVYADGWQGLKGAVPAETGMDNGGTGFLEWNFDDTFWEAETSPYPQPHFIAKATSSFNDLGAPAFALTNGNVAFNRYTTTVARPLAAGLKVGDRMSLEIDNPIMKPLEEGDGVGFAIMLQTKSKGERFGLYTTSGFNDNNWTITDKQGDQASTGWSDEEGSEGFQLTFHLTGEETYRLTITPKSEAPALTFEGELDKAGTGPIERLEIFMFGNGSGNGESEMSGEREFYFNNLRIESSGTTTGGIQKPGDCNGDGSLNISDSICLILQLHQQAPLPLPCEGGNSSPANVTLLDLNGDQAVDVADVSHMLGYLFQGQAPPTIGSQCQPIAGCPDNAGRCDN